MGPKRNDPWALTNREATLDLISQQDHGKSRRIDLEQMGDALRGRVRGQDHVIDDLCAHVKRGMAKLSRRQPIFKAIFAGPPATGKTELCKALAEYLYDDEDSMVFIECSQLGGAMGKSFLVGSGAGFMGSDKPGALTGPLMTDPQRVVVFDEIEKADATVFDVLLSALNDGWIQQQSSPGQMSSSAKADTTQAIFIFTSNLAYDELLRLQSQSDDRREIRKQFRQTLLGSGKFRPEFLSRIDEIYAFKPLPADVRAEITILKIAKNASEYGLEVEYINPQLISEAVDAATKAAGETGDSREQERVVMDMFGDAFIAAKDAGMDVIRLDLDDRNELVISDGL